MPLNEKDLAELRTVKAEIDVLQQRLKDIVSGMRESGATTQEITEALRGE